MISYNIYSLATLYACHSPRFSDILILVDFEEMIVGEIIKGSVC